MNAESIVTSYPRRKGIFLVLTGASLWGISGTVAQYLFQHQGFSPEWLVVIRLLFSGLILLVFAYKNEGHKVWSIWRNKHDVNAILLFSILGMVAVQYTYFAAIKHGNAATATVLQYLGPVLITSYLAIRAKRLPTAKEIMAVILAVVGTLFLVTQGNFYSLSVTGWALFWGLSSAFALAYYTLQPHKLLAKYGSIIVVGWGMFIGGAFFSLVHPPWRFEGEWSTASLIAILFIILFGTLIAFIFYLDSMKYLSASETSLLACVEPLSAAFLSVVWLQVSFGLSEWFGTLCILITIAILSFVENK